MLSITTEIFFFSLKQTQVLFTAVHLLGKSVEQDLSEGLKATKKVQLLVG